MKILFMSANSEDYKTIISLAAVVISAISFYIARLAEKRSKKAELIKTLLGEKENVAFGALKLIRDGLPKNAKERKLLISAVLQACLLESSDRARALLYRVIEKNKSQYLPEFKSALTAINQTFDSMDKYKFTPDELDLSRGRRRLLVVEKIINSKLTDSTSD